MAMVTTASGTGSVGGGQLRAVWHRPYASIVIINVDTSAGRDTLAGFAMVARDKYDEILAALSTYQVVVLSPTIVEALCLQ